MTWTPCGHWAASGTPSRHPGNSRSAAKPASFVVSVLFPPGKILSLLSQQVKTHSLWEVMKSHLPHLPVNCNNSTPHPSVFFVTSVITADTKSWSRPPQHLHSLISGTRVCIMCVDSLCHREHPAAFRPLMHCVQLDHSHSTVKSRSLLDPSDHPQPNPLS